MVNQFIVGKWYVYDPYDDKSRLWYIKYEGIDTLIRASEFIENGGIHRNYVGAFGTKLEQYEELQDISEIVHLLPKEHPDLQQNNEIIFSLY